MISKNILIILTISLVVAIVIINPNILDFSYKGEKRLFPDIIGDSILKNNGTGIYYIKNMTSYDGFRGNIIEGYKAEYSGSNGTMIIFIAQMQDNQSANISLKDMVVRIGYNGSINYNQSLENGSIIKLSVENPEVFVIQRDKNFTWHYTFNKLDKVYWIGFSRQDVQYQVDMLIEVYRNVDKQGKDDYI